jgi:hypothetical protein
MFAVSEKEIGLYKIGDILSSSNSILVLYHNRFDAIQFERVKRFGGSDIFSLRDLSVDGRDIYKLKRGDKFQVMELLRDGKILKVKLIKAQRWRHSCYFFSESIKDYSVLLQEDHLNKIHKGVG